MKIKAVLFDCDGVLVDTEYLKFQAWQNALARQNIPLTLQEYQAVAGNSSKKILQLLIDKKNIPIPEETLIIRRKEYQRLQEQGVPVIHEMVQFARYLSHNKETLGIKLALASSAPRKEILLNLKTAQLDQIFEVIVSGTEDLDAYEDPEGTNKPKPYIYIEASKQLNVPPEQCLVIEDTQAGVEAATAARMITLAVPNDITKEQDFSKATKVIHSIEELHFQFKNLFSNQHKI